METTITRQFITLSLHPEKGRKIIHDPGFSHAVAGAILMDFLRRGEITLQDKRVRTNFRKNGEVLHDIFADMMEKPSRPKRVFYWVERISMKNRRIFRETMNSMVSAGIIRHEQRYFLNIIPYNRYFLTDKRFRKEIVDNLRNILLHDRQPSSDDLMLIGLLQASRSSNILAVHRAEKKPLRKMCEKLSKESEISGEAAGAINEIRSAVISAVALSVAMSQRGS